MLQVSPVLALMRTLPVGAAGAPASGFSATDTVTAAPGGEGSGVCARI